MPTGLQRLDPRLADSMRSPRVGHWNITQQNVVACDSDGLLFMPEEQLQEIMVAATDIKETERRQAEKMRAGISLREQTRLAEYLSARAMDSSVGFREQLRRLGRAIEE